MAHGLIAPSPTAAGERAAEDVIALRPVTAADRPLLLLLYGTTRADELALVPWTAEEKAAFVASQFELQDAWYRQTYPDGEFSIVLRGGEPVGRLYLARLPAEIRLIEVTLLPEARGAGIGSRLLADVLARADAAHVPARLHVEPWNPARRLYERLGFRTIEERGIYLFMERRPAEPA